MSTRRSILAATATAATLATMGLIAPVSDAAAGRVCRGTMGPGYVSGSVQVPAGATCTMNAVVLQGSINVGANATLIASATSISDNLTSAGHRRVDLRTVAVRGATTLTGGGTITVVTSSFDGNVTLNKNTKPGAKSLRDSAIKGKLSCTANTPAPTVRVTVKGGRFGQCAGA